MGGRHEVRGRVVTKPSRQSTDRAHPAARLGDVRGKWRASAHWELRVEMRVGGPGVGQHTARPSEARLCESGEDGRGGRFRVLAPGSGERVDVGGGRS